MQCKPRPRASVRSMIIGLMILILSACAPVVEHTPTTQQPGGTTRVPAETHPAPTATLQQPTAVTAPTQAAKPTDAAPAPGVVSDESDNGFFQGPLSVRITSPADGVEVQTSTISLQGEADPETVISIDDQIVVVDAGGKFTVPLTLPEGPNIIEITASDPDGNQGTAYLTLTYTPE